MTSTYEYQLSMWAPQRQQRAEMGDVLETPRLVEHFAYFSRRSQAQAAADDLITAGFEVARARRGLKTVLKATRTEALGDDQVARFLREVVDIVERHRGDYDGWGATVEA
ncbi:ribonuclease E inhibitor RraB [Microbacterium sp. NPDC091382]|uniref:ribonuclease E inhibitor RraB n=1 Tax=Microbacterium sp. NPDC091382 TaxID=3364210 RepID=UPI00382A3ACA